MAAEKPYATVLLFCYNEEEALPEVIHGIRAALDGRQYSYEILVVDDGSTDQSASVAVNLSCRVIRHGRRRGASAACKTGILSAEGTVIVMLDADGTYTPADIPKMLEYFPQFDQVNGARTSEQGDLPLLRAPVKWLVRSFTCVLAGKKIPDLQTGLKAFKKDVILPYLWILPDKFSHCPLITLAFLCNGHPVKYIPTEYRKRIGGRSKFHPVSDTAYVLMQICRCIMHFNPARIFTPLAVVLIVGLGLAVYSGTFSCSFHFDDQVYIVNNPFIRSLHALLSHWTFYPCRLVTFLSIAFNYHCSRLNVFGYHVFNLAVHLGAAFLVWWLTLLTMATPVMKEQKIARHAHLLALWAGLVFVSHPLQTEAVTYIWQRASCLAALFYLASLCCYVKARLLQEAASAGVLACEAQQPAWARRVYYACALTAAVLAMFTKENAVTLPLMALLYEFSFFKFKRGLNRRYLYIFLMTLLIIPVTIVLTRAQQFQAIQKFSEGPQGTSPVSYLLTQCRVVVTYIRLCFLPVCQNLDYDYSVYKSIFEWPVLISFMFLAGIIFWAKRLFGEYRLPAFSVFWFFLALSLESSLFPLKNVIFEHRLYLPLAGYSMFLVASVYYLCGPDGAYSAFFGKRSVKMMLIVLALIVGVNSILTYQRNRVWKDEITLWNDAVKKSPHKPRAYNNRGFAYYALGKTGQAIADYNQAIMLNPYLADAYVGRGSSFAAQGDLRRAMDDYNKAVQIQPDFKEAYNNRGIFYLNRGDFMKAIADLDTAVRLDPDDAKPYYNRALSHAKAGDYLEALSDYNKAVEADPDYADAYFNRGLWFAQHRYFQEALIDFNKVIQLDPGYANAYNNRGIIEATRGHLLEAGGDFSEAVEKAPRSTEAYNNLINVYCLTKQYDKAWGIVRKAQGSGVSVDPQLLDVLKEASGSGQ